MDHLIETKALNFQYGQQNILQDISLQVPSNSIYGFLGPNGAGKSTTIKILLGLLRIPPEKAFLFGKDIRQARIPILSKIGNLIETPSTYGHLSAYDNLKILHTLYAGPKSRIGEILEIVGLQHAAQKKVKKFSMGMKQRLGIGMALYHDPELLILDEPVNGLDPSGIQEMRQLFFSLQERGKTIFISSHMLSEIEKTCTHLGIIKVGKLLFQGPIGEIQSSTRRSVRLKTDQNKKALQIISSQLQKTGVLDKEWVSVEVQNDEDFNHLLQAIIGSSISILDMEREAPSLEDLFIDLTKN